MEIYQILGSQPKPGETRFFCACAYTVENVFFFLQNLPNKCWKSLEIITDEKKSIYLKAITSIEEKRRELRNL